MSTSLPPPGLDNAYNALLEIISFPFKHASHFEKMRIDPPKGALLYGPPGCGKTMLVQAVTKACDSKLFVIQGPEIFGSDMGDSELRLRERFNEATELTKVSNRPDAVAPSRDRAAQHECRVVTQLLTLMDGLEARGRLVVIGATNKPNSLDPALRRPGRLDREIYIEVPNIEARKQILSHYTQNLVLSDDISLGFLSQVTNGYVSADLASLCREAATLAIRRQFLKIKNAEHSSSKESVTLNDFQQAMKGITPSIQRGHTTSVMDAKWNSVGGLADVKKQLIQVIEWPLKHKETMKRLVRELFKKARSSSPSVIFLDEIDTIVGSRSFSSASAGGGGDSVQERILSTLLNEMDGVEDANNVLVVGATNRPDMLDAALMRPGRFDKLIYATTDLASDVDLNMLAEITERYSGADLQNLCKEASLFAIREFLDATTVSQRHFEKALKIVKPSIASDQIEFYINLSNQYSRNG
ncbi:hypothetical protein H4219_000899 [Mycoemilia scoparia]|uniref:AAA+ ATPase domain-containing protein n=1 Tax=Mycoemilia scoparia TaxID=417184 RepID=A0A9W8DSH4_9FUNG|nr:hypothetical protein H4219_000899 [Mycoemilia scoparia]